MMLSPLRTYRIDIAPKKASSPKLGTSSGVPPSIAVALRAPAIAWSESSCVSIPTEVSKDSVSVLYSMSVAAPSIDVTGAPRIAVTSSRVSTPRPRFCGPCETSCAGLIGWPVEVGVLPHANRHIAITPREHARSFMVDCHSLGEPVISTNMGSLVRGIRNWTAAADMTAALFLIRECKKLKFPQKVAVTRQWGQSQRACERHRHRNWITRGTIEVRAGLGTPVFNGLRGIAPHGSPAAATRGRVADVKYDGARS